MQSTLQNEFSDYPSAATQGMMASSYIFVHVVLPCLIQSVHDLSSRNALLRVKSMGLPIGAGLGSSAAFAVAVAGSCVQMKHKILKSNQPLTDETKKMINAWAYAGEVLIHGLPSGLDNTTSCYGGMVKFTKKDGSHDFEILQNGPQLDILLTNTRVPRSTKQLVANVRSLKECYPAIVQPIFASIQAITDTFLSKIADGGKIEEEELVSARCRERDSSWRMKCN